MKGKYYQHSLVWHPLESLFLKPKLALSLRDRGQPHWHHSIQKATGQVLLLLTGASRQYSLGGPPNTLCDSPHCPSGTVLFDSSSLLGPNSQVTAQVGRIKIHIGWVQKPSWLKSFIPQKPIFLLSTPWA